MESIKLYGVNSTLIPDAGEMIQFKIMNRNGLKMQHEMRRSVSFEKARVLWEEMKNNQTKP